jgi:hypothetical protein
MTTTLNASTAGAGGFIATSDNSGILALQTAGTTALSIDASQNLSFTKGFTVGSTAFPAFSAYLSANQSVSSTVGTTLACNTEEYDTGGCYNNTGSTVTLNGLSVPAYSFCPNVAGYYTVNAGYQLGGVSSFSRALITCSKNGSGYKRLIDMGATSYVLAGTTVIYLNGTGDYVNFYGYISASGTLVFNGGSDATWINGAMVRSA